jgi:hypothetical protein
VLDFLLDFVEEVGVDDPFIPSSIGLLLEKVDFGDFFIVLMQNLLDIVLHLFNLLLNTASHELF